MPRFNVSGLLIGSVPPCRVAAYGFLWHRTHPEDLMKQLPLGETDSMPGGFFTMDVDLVAAITREQIDLDTVAMNKISVGVENPRGVISQHYPYERRLVDLAAESAEPIDFGHIKFLRAPIPPGDDHRQWKDIFCTRSRQAFRTGHSVHFNLANNDEVWTVSGVVDDSLKGAGPDWKTYHLVLEVPLPPDMSGGNQYFKVNQWLTSITPVSMSNRSHAVNAGWGVGNYGGPYDVNIMPFNPEPTMVLQADVKVRDIDGYVESFAYQSTIIGKKCTLP